MATVGSDGKLTWLDAKYIGPEAALRAIEKDAIEIVGYLVRMVETRIEVKARLA